MRIALIPLDERPVNTRYPQMLGEIGGANVVLPPAELRGLQREPADVPAVAEWLRETVATGVDAVAASCDFLGYGNLINARISNDSATAVLGRLSLLEEIGAKVPLHAFSLITRVSNADDNVEEPPYWKEWGTQFYAYSRLAHRRMLGDPLSDEDRGRLELLEGALPPDLMSDWLTRRLRNHTVNLALIDMAARAKVASLLLTSDDTAAYGFPTRERDWLRDWLGLIGPKASANIRMHPGADEVGSALVAKLINRHAGRKPRVFVIYAIPGDAEIVAPYEDRPVRETVLGQIEACGCIVAAEPQDCDFVLGVVTPSPRRTDYRPEFLEEDRRERAEAYDNFLKQLGSIQAAGLPAALADVAYPNGSDPLMSEMLLHADSALKAGSLAAYGAWNTAGNTLGTVVAQASCALYIDSSEQEKAQARFLAHRFIEDYGYQQIVRREARDFAQERWGRREPDPESGEEQSKVCEFIERRLGAILDRLHAAGIGQYVELMPGSVRLPWRRTFEVDFELTSV